MLAGNSQFLKTIGNALKTSETKLWSKDVRRGLIYCIKMWQIKQQPGDCKPQWLSAPMNFRRIELLSLQKKNHIKGHFKALQ